MSNRGGLGCMGRLIQRIFNTITNCYLRACPRLYHMCYDPIGTHKKARVLLGFLLGMSLAVLFYVTIIMDLGFSAYTSLALGGIIITMLSIGCATSIQVRCVCLLTIPAFLGRAGQSVLKALVLGYIIAGPIFNLTYNGKEVVRTFTCTTQLTYNLTKTRFDLMFKPFQQAIMAMKKSTNEVKDTLSSVRELVDPITKEIEEKDDESNFDEVNDYVDISEDTHGKKKEKREEVPDFISKAQSYETNYQEKIGIRCKQQLNRGSEKCMDIFSNSYNKCYEKLSWVVAWLLCWPMKLTFVCNLVQALGGQNICNPEGHIDAGIGQGYVSLKNAKERLSDDLKDVRLQYKLDVIPNIIDVHGVGDAAKAVMHEFNSRRDFFDTVMVLLKRCLTFMFLQIIISAQNYHDRYLTEIEHDNQYITSYFRRIDLRRKDRGSITLLPLKKMEKEKFIDPYELKLSAFQQRNIFGQTIKLILEVITATIFIVLDRLVYETLDLVARHGHLDYVQEGQHDLQLDVRGTGFVAALIRNLINGFNIKKRVKMVVSNSACLPRPSQVSQHILIKIYGTYLGIWVMFLLSSYTQRLQRCICAFFYVKREKRRVLYLYNETLRRRLGYLGFMRSKIRQQVRERRLERDMNPWLALTIDLPRCCGWLKCFSCARQKCLICGETEPRVKSDFYTCTTPGCFFVHCPECWRSVAHVCYACTEFSDSESDDGYDSHTIV